MTEPQSFSVFSAYFVKSAVSLKDLPQERLPQVAFLGRSNVGKSTLLNAIMGKKGLVKTSSTPGKTRELNFFKVNESFYLVDLPGVGYAKLSFKTRDQMTKSVEDYLEKAEDLQGVVYLIDIRHAGTSLDVETVEYIRNKGLPVLLVANKEDKVNRKEFIKNMKLIQEKFRLEEKPLSVSAVSKKGLDILWFEIINAIRD